MKRISDRLFVMNEFAISFKGAGYPRESLEPGKITRYTRGDSNFRIKNWGKNNDLPQQRECLVEQNNIIPALLKTKRDILLGQGLFAYREVYVDKKKTIEEVEMPESAMTFFEETQIDNYLSLAARDLEFHANIFAEFVRTHSGKIKSIQANKCIHMRSLEMLDSGIIPGYVWSGNWGKNSTDKGLNRYVSIPAYLGEDEKQRKFIYHHGNNILGDEYYFEPYWWGGRKWIEVSNEIPEYHLNNTENGYNIRFHIEVPEGYFADNTAENLEGDGIKAAQEKEIKAKEEFIERMNKFLAGIKNVGRAIYTDYVIDATGKAFPGIKITPLSVDLKDEALLKLFEKSNAANISAHAIHPTLANIETAGKLSSGTEIRNAYLMYLAISIPAARQVLLKAPRLAWKINGFDPSIKIGIRDLEITKLDENKTGSKEVTNEDNSSTNQ